MATLLQNWNLMRVIRLVLAGLFLAAGVSNGDTIAYVAAAILGVQAIFNVGCCGATCAPVTVDRSQDPNVQDISFEELK